MARHFDAAAPVHQYLEATGLAVTGSTLPITLAAWVKLTSTGAVQDILGACNAAATAYYLLRLYPDNRIVGLVPGAAGAFGPNVLTYGVWTHVAAVFASATSRTCYINGTPGLTDTGNFAIGTPTHTAIGRLAAYPAGYGYANGDIAHCAIWNAVLTPLELRYLSAGRLPSLIQPTALRSYWPLNG